MFSGLGHFTGSHTGEEWLQEPLARQDDSLSPARVYPLLHLKKIEENYRIYFALFCILLSVPETSKNIKNLYILEKLIFFLLK